MLVLLVLVSPRACGPCGGGGVFARLSAGGYVPQFLQKDLQTDLVFVRRREMDKLFPAMALVRVPLRDSGGFGELS